MKEKPNAYDVTLAQLAQENVNLKLNVNALQLDNEVLREKIVDAQTKLDEYAKEPNES